MESRKPDPPLILPANWKRTKRTIEGLAYRSSAGLLVLISEHKYNDQWWKHVSFSRNSRIPDYTDIQMVKRIFVGTDKKAIQIFPAEKEHVNIHPNTLHLFCPLEFDPLPDFRIMGML